MISKFVYIFLICFNIVNSIPVETGNYNDTFARYKMVGFAAAAYSDNPYLCTNNLKTNVC